MLVQIAVGTGLLVVNIIIAAVAAMVLEVIFQTAHPWLMREPHRPKLVVLLAGVSLWVLGVVTAGVWVWACLMTFRGFLAIREPLPGTPNMPGSGGGRIENGSAVAGRAVV